MAGGHLARYLIIAFIMFVLAGTTKEALSEETDPASAYCKQTYGTELRALSNRDYDNAREFDPRCPTWLPLATRIAAFGSTSDLKKMLDAGTPTNVSVSSSWSPQMTLLDAAIRGNKADSVRLLLERGASVQEGIPVLSVFIPFSTLETKPSYAERLEILDILLSAGADPNRPCLDDETRAEALHAASSQADIASVERLLAAGAKADGAVCPGELDYNRIMLPLFFKPFSKLDDDNLTDEQIAIFEKENSRPGFETAGPSPLEIAIAGDWLSSLKTTPKALEMWRMEDADRRARFRRVAVLLVEHGAVAIGTMSDFHLLRDDEPKLVSISIAAARKAGYEAELIARLEERIERLPPENTRTVAYLAMLKACSAKVMEARGDHFRLCASEE